MGRQLMPLKADRKTALWFVIFWAVIGVGSYVLGVRNELGQRAENSALDAAAFTYDPPAPLNLVSIPMVAIALAIIAIIAFFAHGLKRMIVVTVVPALGIVASQLLKSQLLTRPSLFELDVPNTFPSGHMTVFTVLAAGLIWAVPTKVRAFVTLASSVLISAAAWQLLEFGWHRPSDVFGAIALGTVAFSLACLIRPASGRGEAVMGRSVAIGLAMCGWILIAAGLVLAGLGWAQHSSTLMLSAGQFGSIGVSALACRALLILSAGRR